MFVATKHDIHTYFYYYDGLQETFQSSELVL